MSDRTSITLRELKPKAVFRIGFRCTLWLMVSFLVANLIGVPFLITTDGDGALMLEYLFALISGTIMGPFVVGLVLALGHSIINMIAPWRSAKITLELDPNYRP